MCLKFFANQSMWVQATEIFLVREKWLTDRAYIRRRNAYGELVKIYEKFH